MESKYILRIGLILSFMLLFSLYSAEQKKNATSTQQSNQANIFPYNGIFHSVAYVFDEAIHADGRHISGNPIAITAYQQLPPALVSGVVNQEAIWQVKVGPFYDMAQVEELTHYLLKKNYQVLLKVDLDESGYVCSAYVQPTAQKHVAETVRKELVSRYPGGVEITTGYL